METKTRVLMALGRIAHSTCLVARLPSQHTGLSYLHVEQRDGETKLTPRSPAAWSGLKGYIQEGLG